MKTRKTPMRRCIGCQQSKEKRELIRIVRGPEGDVSLDPTGRKSGRGAYLCRNEACLAQAMKTKALERSLETAVDAQLYEILQNDLKREIEHG